MVEDGIALRVAPQGIQLIGGSETGPSPRVPTTPPKRSHKLASFLKGAVF